MKNFVYAFFAASLLPTGAAFGQCTANQYEVVVEIMPDAFYTETTWDITSPGGTIYASGSCAQHRFIHANRLCAQ